MKWFSSDWHLGHKRVIEFANRPFKDIKEMDEVIIENMIKPLKKGDDFYFLGDLYWDPQSFWKFFNQVPKGIRLHWIIGNHDDRYIMNHVGQFAEITPMMDVKFLGQHAVICHFPMMSWNRSHYNSFMLFGHHHVNGHAMPTIQGKMLNVNCEFNNFKPWSENDIVEYMSHRPDNFDYIPKDKNGED